MDLKALACLTVMGILLIFILAHMHVDRKYGKKGKK